MTGNKKAVELLSRFSQSIKNFCCPLNEYLGISLFIYFKIYHDATYITLSNDFNLTEEYCLNIHNDNLYFQRYLEKESKSRFILWPQEPNNLGMRIFFNRNYWHGLNILRLNNDNIEGCSFLSNKDNPRINEFFIKNCHILEKFAEYFKVIFASEISQCNEYRARFKDGFNFYLPPYDLKKQPDINGFFKTIGIKGERIKIKNQIIHFTIKEMQCLELMAKGYTLREIGKELLLSHRTIETHLNNIKNKTGYYYKSDLTRLYSDFIIGSPANPSEYKLI